MATLAVNPDEESTESCIVVAHRRSPRSKSANIPKKTTIPMRPATRGRPRGQPQPVKRPRGRPRKPRNNTAETAIILSDSDSEGEGSEPPRKDKKRPITKLESPSSAPDPKRPAPSYHASSSSKAVPAPSRPDIDEVRQQLASEKKLRADAEGKQAQLQELLDEKDSSWAADLAAQAMPLQLQLQRITKEKKDLDVTVEDLETRLQASLGKNQEYESSLEALTASAAGAEDIKTKAVAQEALIVNQGAEIAQLKSAVVSRAKELAAASQRFGTLTATLRDLTTRHATATTIIQQHGARIQHLTHALSEAKNKPAANGPLLTAAETGRVDAAKMLVKAEEKLNTTEKELREVKARRKETDDKVAQQLATATNKWERVESKLRAKEQQLAHSEELLAELKTNLHLVKKQLTEAEQAVPAQAQESINNLTRERDGILRETHARLEEMGVLQNEVGRLNQAVATLEQEKQTLTAAASEKDDVVKQLTAHQNLVGVLQREREQAEASSSRAWEEIVPLKNQLANHKQALLDLRNENLRWTAASENALQKITSVQGERDHFRDLAGRLQGETASLRAEYTQLVNKANAREAQLTEIISQMNHNLDSRHGDVVQLRQNLVRQGLREDTLQKDMAAKNTRLLQLEAELKEQQTVVATKQQEVDSLREGINNLHAEVTKLESNFATQREELQQRDAMLTDKEKAIAAKRTQIQQLQETVSELTTEKSQLRDDIAVQKARLLQLAAQLAQLTNDNAELQSTNTANEQTIDSLRQQLFSVTREKANLQQQTTTNLTEIATLKTQLTDANHTIEQLTQTAATLHDTTSALQTDLHTLTLKQTSTTNLVTTLETETTALRTQLATTTTQAAQDIAALEARIAQLDVEYGALEEVRRKQEGEVEKLRVTVAEVLAEGEALEEYLAKRDGCIERVRGFVKTLPQWMESTLIRK
ncbi:uncharacterized protein B0H64DRAFT_367824 [Chaetomium fimeti]|uniref:Uncharacterized protein n=1 Tax=Chaetomium fimeti TaxID=1854472 RepID=A0AAE0LNC6_9PEZI|nr:hypothetical protein B0H64DRAFT_367824 [Chaetomium fimeti]